MNQKNNEDHILWHQSGVNKNGEPFVQLFQDDKIICQFTPEQARDSAKNLLEATEAAEQDAFLLEFFGKKLRMPMDEVYGIVVEYRQWREARGKKGPPSDRREFVVTDQHEKPEGEQP